MCSIASIDIKFEYSKGFIYFSAQSKSMKKYFSFSSVAYLQPIHWYKIRALAPITLTQVHK